MKLCSRCNKRPAVIYINKIQEDKVSTEGLCMHCAREMKIKPFSDYMDQMGIKDDDMDVLEEQMGHMMEGVEPGEGGMPPKGAPDGGPGGPGADGEPPAKPGE